MELRSRLKGRAKELVLQRLRVLLRGYSGNLKSAVEAHRNGWLPAEGDPRLKELLSFLTKCGHSEVDDFLLRFGLTVPSAAPA